MEKTEYTTPHFHGKCRTALNKLDIGEGMQESIRKVVNSFQEYCRNGSMWKLSQIKSITLNIAKYQPLKGSSYIPTPPTLHSKKAIINVKNSDSKCFMWSVLAALHPVNQNAHRVSHYEPYEKRAK